MCVCVTCVCVCVCVCESVCVCVCVSVCVCVCVWVGVKRWVKVCCHSTCVLGGGGRAVSVVTMHVWEVGKEMGQSVVTMHVCVVCGGGGGGGGEEMSQYVITMDVLKGWVGGEMGQCVVVTMHVLGVGVWAGER